MNNILKHAVQLPCPLCKAAAGEQCDRFVLKAKYPGSLDYTCPERQRITPKRISNIGTLFSRVKTRDTRGFSNHCKLNKCGKCRGVLLGNHGMKPKCKCKCHKEGYEEIS